MVHFWMEEKFDVKWPDMEDLKIPIPEDKEAEAEETVLEGGGLALGQGLAHLGGGDTLGAGVAHRVVPQVDPAVVKGMPPGVDQGPMIKMELMHLTDLISNA